MEIRAQLLESPPSPGRTPVYVAAAMRGPHWRAQLPASEPVSESSDRSSTAGGPFFTRPLLPSLSPGALPHRTVPLPSLTLLPPSLRVTRSKLVVLNMTESLGSSTVFSRGPPKFDGTFCEKFDETSTAFQQFRWQPLREARCGRTASRAAARGRTGRAFCEKPRETRFAVRPHGRSVGSSMPTDRPWAWIWAYVVTYAAA